MIIDIHAHIYPEKIAEKATLAVSHFYEEAPMAFKGISDKLIESGSKIGVEKYVVHSVSTKPEQVESINNFIISETQKHPEFIGFGTMHQDYKDFEQELKRIKQLGLVGLKLHPDFQKFQADCPQMDDVYEVLAELKMPVLFHAGDCRYDFSGPRRILNVLKKHPNLTIIAAHFGGYTEWEESFEVLAGNNLYFDTSSSTWKIPMDLANKIIKKHGVDKMLFGSDFPMWNHTDELARFNKLDLTEADKEAVLYKNAKELLGL